MKRFFSYVLLLASSAFTAQAFTPDSDGIYAVFDVTYFDPASGENIQGEFTVQLFYPETPVTCANFIGLAEGSLDWFDFEAWEVKSDTPFFDGLTFHRVVPNFIIQTGSRNGLGNDGPGWRIPDEAHPDLNHVGGGVLSMANNGANTGGSQFFITMAQFEETEAQLATLNGKHTVFGFVKEGHMVSQAINRTPIQGQTPIKDAIINSVTIIKEGDGANAWDPSLYWTQPVFNQPPVTVSYDLEDLDNDPETADVRILKASFERDPDNFYYFDEGSDLETWRRITFPRGKGNRIENEGEDTEVSYQDRFIAADVFTDDRHFYRLVETELSPLTDLDSKRLTINFDQIEVDPDRVTYQPETMVFDFYDDNDGSFLLTRSDSQSMKPLGVVNSYEAYPLSQRDQIFLNNSIFSDFQVYLNYTDEARSSGEAYIYYPDGRPEGSTVTGTFTIGEGDSRRVPQDKNLTNITFTIVNTPDSGDAVTTTYDLDLWDNFSDESFAENFEGGYRITQSSNEFVRNGILIYNWIKVGDDTYIVFDFDVANDMQLLLKFDPDTQTSGDADVYFPAFASFETANVTIGPGDPRPNSQDKNGSKLVLTLDLQGSNQDPLQSTIDIDFYEGFVGAFEATRTDTEANQFGLVDGYQWFDDGEDIRVDLLYDQLPPMQVYLTFENRDANDYGSGTAKVNLVQTGQVVDATFSTSEGNPPLVHVPMIGTGITLDFPEGQFDVITISLESETQGWYDYTIPDQPVRPTGEIREYEWFPRPDGSDLVFIDYDRLPTMQLLLNYSDSSRTSGTAEILLPDSGTVNASIPFTVGPAKDRPQSENKAGKKLTVDINTNTVDLIEMNFLTESSGTWKRFWPGSGDPDTGEITLYEWYADTGGDQVKVQYDFFLDTQIFLTYDTATTGTAIVLFTTGGDVEEGTFTISDAD